MNHKSKIESKTDNQADRQRDRHKIHPKNEKNTDRQVARHPDIKQPRPPYKQTDRQTGQTDRRPSLEALSERYEGL